MSVDDPNAGLEERLRRLVELRKIEEQKYGELLTLLDAIWHFPLPEEIHSRIPEIKDDLNHVWPFTLDDLAAAQSEERTFWKEVARNFLEYVEPFVIHQRKVNSLVVHLLNEHSEAVHKSFEEVRKFQNTLIHYFQRIIPVIDTKFREMTGTAENFQLGLREYSDLMFKTLDQKIHTLQADVADLQSLEISIRSLHQLANTWKTTSSMEKPAAESRNQDGYYIQEESERTERKDRLATFLQYFQDGNVSPVFDIACGTGEFLELLKEASIDAVGVDDSEPAIERCLKAGLKAVYADPVHHLLSYSENSLGGIFCTRGADHFTPQQLLSSLQAAQTRLKDQGVLVLHAINVSSAAGLLQQHSRYPDLRSRFHPETLKYLVSACGFRKAEIIYADPVPAPEKLRILPKVENELEALLNENIEKLNHLLFDSRLYAVVARK